MKPQINAVQESIKIALDAADAAYKLNILPHSGHEKTKRTLERKKNRD